MNAELIDHMGSDLTVVNAARVSFDKQSDWEYANIADTYLLPTAVLSDRDTKLINYLATHGHWTPFAHVVITMRETVPIFVARQRFKHMVGFVYNEISRRYVSDDPDFYTPDEWRSASSNRKQGSGGTHPRSADWMIRYLDWINEGRQLYNEMIADGIAPEQARMVLPQSMITSYYVTGSLYAWAHAYNLRIEGHAQKEIQTLAKLWDREISSISELSVSWDKLK